MTEVNNKSLATRRKEILDQISSNLFQENKYISVNEQLKRDNINYILKEAHNQGVINELLTLIGESIDLKNDKEQLCIKKCLADGASERMSKETERTSKIIDDPLLQTALSKGMHTKLAIYGAEVPAAADTRGGVKRRSQKKRKPRKSRKSIKRRQTKRRLTKRRR